MYQRTPLMLFKYIFYYDLVILYLYDIILLRYMGFSVGYFSINTGVKLDTIHQISLLIIVLFNKKKYFSLFLTLFTIMMSILEI